MQGHRCGPIQHHLQGHGYRAVRLRLVFGFDMVIVITWGEPEHAPHKRVKREPCLSVCLSICLSVCLSVRMYMYMYILL